MGVLENGLYLIQSVVGRGPYIGLDPSGLLPRPVISDAEDKIWKVERTGDTTYVLTIISGEPLSVDKEGERLVGSLGPRDWVIKERDNAYAIEEPGDILVTRAWTLTDVEIRKSTVVLNDILLIVRKEQLWNFIPADYQ